MKIGNRIKAPQYAPPYNKMNKCKDNKIDIFTITKEKTNLAIKEKHILKRDFRGSL